MKLTTTTELLKRRIPRRNFLAGAGAVGAATALAGCSAPVTLGPPYVPPTTPAPTEPMYIDADYLNFALNLEYLEAQFYLYAATGSGLAVADMGASPGTVTVPSVTKIPGLTSLQQDIINEIAYDEQQHVRFLRSALGSSAVDMPAIDLVNSFQALATAAGISIPGATTGSTVPFNPFVSFDAFLVGAFIFEDVGVTAYSGAAPALTTPAYLNAAAGIQAVEAYHAAYIRTILTGKAIAAAAVTGGPAYPYLGFANQVSALRGVLGLGNETSLTLPTSTSTPSSIVAASPTTAIAYARTVDQVLHIVYGSLTFTTSTGAVTAAGVTKGGFFPNGLNGTINTTYA